jgi:hypothetical protein
VSSPAFTCWSFPAREVQPAIHMIASAIQLICLMGISFLPNYVYMVSV